MQFEEREEIKVQRNSCNLLMERYCFEEVAGFINHSVNQTNPAFKQHQIISQYSEA